MSPNPLNSHVGTKAIEAKGLSKSFKTGRSHIQVLKSVDVDALHGDLTMVMGPSGSGKTTSLRLMASTGPEARLG